MRSFSDIAAEGILLAGAGRAILLQVANPAIGYGVAQHSDFSNRPLERLENTMTYIYAVIFGSIEERELVVRQVNEAHIPVKNKQGHPGYDAFDPELQLWVAATLYETAISVYERLFGQLDEKSAEIIYQEYKILGTALQVPSNLWPKDRTTFCEYWHNSLDKLAVDHLTRQLAHDLLYPKTAPVWLRMVLPLARLLTAGLLPSRVRSEFRMPWSANRQKRFDRTLKILVALYPRLPLIFRHFPKSYYLRRLRKR